MRQLCEAPATRLDGLVAGVWITLVVSASLLEDRQGVDPLATSLFACRNA